MIPLEYTLSTVVNLSLEPFQKIPPERIKEIIESVSLVHPFIYPGPKIRTEKTGFNNNLCFECKLNQISAAVTAITFRLNEELNKIS